MGDTWYRDKAHESPLVYRLSFHLLLRIGTHQRPPNQVGPIGPRACATCSRPFWAKITSQRNIARRIVFSVARGGHSSRLKLPCRTIGAKPCLLGQMKYLFWPSAIPSSWAPADGVPPARRAALAGGGEGGRCPTLYERMHGDPIPWDGTFKTLHHVCTGEEEPATDEPGPTRFASARHRVSAVLCITTNTARFDLLGFVLEVCASQLPRLPRELVCFCTSPRPVVVFHDSWRQTVNQQYNTKYIVRGQYIAPSARSGSSSQPSIQTLAPRPPSAGRRGWQQKHEQNHSKYDLVWNTSTSAM